MAPFLNRIPFSPSGESIPVVNFNKSFRGLNTANSGLDFTNLFEKQHTDAFSIGLRIRRSSTSTSQMRFSHDGAGSDPRDGMFFRINQNNDVLGIRQATQIFWQHEDGTNTTKCDFTWPGEGMVAGLTWYTFTITYAGSREVYSTGLTAYRNTTTGNRSNITDPPGSGTIPYSTNIFQLASTVAGTNANLELGEIALWNKELSAAEVSAYHNGGSSINLYTLSTSSNLEHWYNFSTDTINAGNTITDLKGSLNGVFDSGVTTTNNSNFFP